MHGVMLLQTAKEWCPWLMTLLKQWRIPSFQRFKNASKLNNSCLKGCKQRGMQCCLSFGQESSQTNLPRSIQEMKKSKRKHPTIARRCLRLHSLSNAYKTTLWPLLKWMVDIFATNAILFRNQMTEHTWLLKDVTNVTTTYVRNVQLYNSMIFNITILYDDAWKERW